MNGVSREPFGDLTNTPRADSKELKRQRDRARSASLTEEQKSERNKRRREAYRRKKGITAENESIVTENEHAVQ
ncbi:hypothetical protein PVAP13_7KG031581 [Panicum virgatum]|uniref:Uncharacterized protein n=1 Tax=Panicum virgatum TaxID=38727 RepID=A0A8T0Q878_PANVG|nr:hypothetical protein PVAP13_7KG031581 [Panicum virgatum]